MPAEAGPGVGPLEGARVLVVEDDRALSELLGEELEDLGFEARVVGSAEAARGVLESWLPDLVVSDLRLPGADGFSVLEFTRSLEPAPGFVVVTAFGTVPQAVKCLKAGADDFLTKPLDLDHLRVAVERALERRRLRGELRRFRELVADGDFHGMLGRSGPMRRLFEQIRRLARASGPVLILGESGSGKELVARAIHAESARADGPFIPVNCAGVPKELMESEFFGHTAGAFTGATGERRGLFEEARGGSLLLDEIAGMPLALQAKLLRVLENGEVRPVGGNRGREVDVRVLASTHRDPRVEMEAGRFREDLYYRLETFTLRVPPLRDRGEDIELLAAHFVRRYAAALGREPPALAPETAEFLRVHEFPGNVRELQNAMERAVTFCQGSTVRPEHLPARLLEAGRSRAGVSGAGPASILLDGDLPSLEELERRYIRHVLDRVEGNKRRAAKILGIARRTLYRRLEDAEARDSGDESRSRA